MQIICLLAHYMEISLEACYSSQKAAGPYLGISFEYRTGTFIFCFHYKRGPYYILLYSQVFLFPFWAMLILAPAF